MGMGMGMTILAALMADGGSYVTTMLVFSTDILRYAVESINKGVRLLIVTTVEDMAL
jgi:hypothetical protein